MKNIILKPQHMLVKKNIKYIDKAGYFPNKKSVEDYSLNFKKAGSYYHNDRLRALNFLHKKIKKKITILDFGCGDGIQFLKLKLSCKFYYGIDVSPFMINNCEKNIKKIKKKLLIGGVEKLKEIKSNSIDLMISINTLGYLNDKDLNSFLMQSKRVVKKNGYFSTLNGNELFNLFALNYGAKIFFKKHFNQSDKHINLLLKKKKNYWVQAKTFNPLNFNLKLKKFNFLQIKQSFAGYHKFSPEIGKMIYGTKNPIKTRLKMRNLLFDPNKLNDSEKWRCLFRCSMFGSIFKKI
jgi:ubiquinone/menaquinone biosynthesis C-methylase UbiE